MDSEKELSPKEFLRARRPEHFSDSAVEHERPLNRSLLEYHISTLTSRSQELDFEGFARKLAEREICPNLIPHTGPTGGGDSKVDTETFPVADRLTFGWHSGIGVEASKERWAFAFSAKQVWEEKVRTDIAKIVKTGRGYTRIFFVSSQFIPDKKRAQFEDELTKKHAVNVRIFDRQWILDRVFTKQHENLAIEGLRLSVAALPVRKTGPNDSQRESELACIEKSIQEEIQRPLHPLKLVDDCLQSAILSRSLDRPRTETDGYFARASRVAETFGTPGQKLECLYQRARTAFWWHEDYVGLSSIYGQASQHVEAYSNPHDLERLRSLWFLLHCAVIREKIAPEQIDFENRTAALRSKLAAAAQDIEAPSSALSARTQLLELELTLALGKGDDIDHLLSQMSDVVRQSQGLVGYAFEPFARFVIEMGDVLQQSPAYSDLFETILEVTNSRKSDIDAAEILVTRGTQQLDAGNPYDAIATFGRALRKLYKQESRPNAIEALYLCACCYEHVGLFWAARGTLLMAEWLADGEFAANGQATRLHAACSNRLKWIELQLGRVTQSLSWHYHEHAIRTMLSMQGRELRKEPDEDLRFDFVFGGLLVRTDPWDLKRLSRMPDVLERHGLLMAADSLLFLLGYEEKIKLPDPEPGQELPGLQVMIAELDKKVGSELPERPSFYEQRKILLSSQIIGCKVQVTVQNRSSCLRLTESILAALESFLSTSAITRMMAREPILTMEVMESDSLAEGFIWTISYKSGRPHVEITCRPWKTEGFVPSTQTNMKSKLAELVTSVVAHAVMIDDSELTLEKLARDERVFERAIDFAGNFVSANNILGLNGDDLSALYNGQEIEYPSRRSVPWESGKWRNGVKSEADTQTKYLSGAVPPRIRAALLDRKSTKQSQIQTISLIREHLWNNAGWYATAYLCDPDKLRPPLLVLAFEDKQRAEEIITDLKNELGAEDRENRLRITVIRGIERSNPFFYRVVLTSNIDRSAGGEMKYFAVLARILNMRATSDANLERFLDAFQHFKGFFLTAGFAEGGELPNIQPFFEQSILKRKLVLKWARDIGLSNPDSVGISPDDDPVLLPDTLDAPVIELLQWKRKLKKEKSEV